LSLPLKEKMGAECPIASVVICLSIVDTVLNVKLQLYA